MAVGISVIVGQILLEGIKLWSSERKHAFSKKYHKILTSIDRSEGAQFPHYTDASLMRDKKALEAFLEAYYGTIKEESNAKSTNTDTNS